MSKPEDPQTPETSETPEPLETSAAPVRPRWSYRKWLGLAALAVLGLMLILVTVSESGLFFWARTNKTWSSTYSWNTSRSSVNNIEVLLTGFQFVPEVQVDGPSGLGKQIANRVAEIIDEQNPGQQSGNAKMTIVISTADFKGLTVLPFYKTLSGKLRADCKIEAFVQNSSVEVWGVIEIKLTQTSYGLNASRAFREEAAVQIVNLTAAEIRKMIEKNGS